MIRFYGQKLRRVEKRCDYGYVHSMSMRGLLPDNIKPVATLSDDEISELVPILKDIQRENLYAVYSEIRPKMRFYGQTVMKIYTDARSPFRNYANQGRY